MEWKDRQREYERSEREASQKMQELEFQLGECTVRPCKASLILFLVVRMPSLLVLTQILSDFFQKENEKLQLKNIQSEQNLQDAKKRLKNSEENLSAVKSKLFELRGNYEKVFPFFCMVL